jgi:TfoX/Sxy family transcriptional regulator of competence genes
MTDLGARIEAYLEGRGDVSEGRLLSGTGYFVDGRLVAAVLDDDLCLNVGRERWQPALAEPGARPLIFADRPVPGWVMVEGGSLRSELDLAQWIEPALGS